jgi:exopolyphosphatase/guanosine-5'-triphosphate,3'-diphosphate pyrophosphatase
MTQGGQLTDVQRSGQADDLAGIGRVGVVDIGSNTVRLVVYESHTMSPIPIFNEKVQCALARDMSRTGRLSPRGVSEALRSLARFTRLAEAMGVTRLELVATAAVRDSSDSAAFVEQVEKVSGHPVHVLSGAEEARLAAVGLL